MPDIMFTPDKLLIQHVRIVPPTTAYTIGRNAVRAVRVVTEPSGDCYTNAGFPIQAVRVVDAAGNYSASLTPITTQPEDMWTTDGQPIEHVRIIAGANSPELARTTDGFPIDAVRLVDAAGLLVPPVLAETTAWQAAVVANGGTVSPGRLTVVDNLVAALKAAGIWTSLDRLWLYAAENTQSAQVDLVTLASHTLPVAPTFTVDRGYQGNTTTMYINTGFNPTTGTPQYVRDSASFGYWEVIAPTGGASTAIGATNPAARIVASPVAPQRACEVNNAADVAAIYNPSTSLGLFHAQRPNSANIFLFRNGVSVATVATASAALVNAVFFTCAGNTAGTPGLFCNGQIGCAFAGNSLAGKEVAFYNALRTYMTAVGVP